MYSILGMMICIAIAIEYLEVIFLLRRELL